MNKKMMVSGMAAVVSTALLVAGGVGNAGARSTEVTHSVQTLQNSIVKSFESQVFPLKTIDPTQSFADLKPLKKMIGDAHYVGLGEETHGSSELFTMKFRLVKYLVTEMGFTNFGMEEDWGNGLKLNEYIHTGKGDPKQFLKLLYPTDEIVAMVEWMKDYNANPKNKKKIQFIGLDLKSLDKDVYDTVINYVKKHHPDMLSEVVQNYKDMPAVTVTLQEYMKLTHEEKARFQANAERVVQLLEKVAVKDKKKANSNELKWVKGTAKAIKHYTTMMIPEDYPSLVTLHDQYLADLAIWAKETLGGKTMVWGHNIHVAKGVIDKEWYPKPAGEFLKERVGDQYVVIGTSMTEGHFTTYEFDMSGGGKIMTGAIPQQKNSTNDMFGKVSYERFLLDARHMKGEAGRWVKEKQPFLSLGARIIPGLPPYFDVPLRERFDILVHIRNTSPSHMLQVQK
ncbi:erythromycin esterase [Paenibacillus alvei TS-15]|uniref:Erythromycin esterase n=1 Tax=Paenibacillus alvei TS-15 TaxID=1117108 RepID=S9SRV4_PAEAL|nr:erythromycin esterase family protein [Paenibacillus alvei]EPY06883.1 erythromycin esterase [Paenibacillus alvei TS-15]